MPHLTAPAVPHQALRLRTSHIQHQLPVTRQFKYLPMKMECAHLMAHPPSLHLLLPPSATFFANQTNSQLCCCTVNTPWQKASLPQCSCECPLQQQYRNDLFGACVSVWLQVSVCGTQMVAIYHWNHWNQRLFISILNPFRRDFLWAHVGC